MASTLEMSYAELVIRVGDFLGLGRDATAWSTDDGNRVDGYIESGYRSFLYPQNVGKQYAHEWKFLHPMDSVTMITSTALTGTLTFTDESTAVTGSGTLFTTELSVGDTVKLDDNDTWYTVASITSATALVLKTEFDGTTASGDGSSGPEYRYTMDADFTGIEGAMTYFPGDGFKGPLQVGEGQIRAMRQSSANVASGRPTHFAIRWLEATGEATHRAELIFYPTPNDTYVLNFPKQMIPNALSATYTTPLGGAVHSETVLELCLRAAELGLDDERGIHHQTAMELLETSIAHDRRLTSPSTLGYNGDRSGYVTASRIVDPVTVYGDAP
ncbi:hypothetical protein HQ535_09600 [bacterium]|nr:hypothetical protein [bacterium]